MKAKGGNKNMALQTVYKYDAWKQIMLLANMERRQNFVLIFNHHRHNYPDLMDNLFVITTSFFVYIKSYVITPSL